MLLVTELAIFVDYYYECQKSVMLVVLLEDKNLIYSLITTDFWNQWRFVYALLRKNRINYLVDFLICLHTKDTNKLVEIEVVLRNHSTVLLSWNKIGIKNLTNLTSVVFVLLKVVWKCIRPGEYEIFKASVDHCYTNLQIKKKLEAPKVCAQYS